MVLPSTERPIVPSGRSVVYFEQEGGKHVISSLTSHWLSKIAACLMHADSNNTPYPGYYHFTSVLCAVAQQGSHLECCHYASSRQLQDDTILPEKTCKGLSSTCRALCCAVLCCAVLCCAVLCCAVLCCAVLCCAVLCWAGLFCAALPCAPLPCPANACTRQ